MKFYPDELASRYLALIGVNYEKIYNEDNGMTRAQLSILSAAPFFKDMKKNAYMTIHRLHASANRKNIDFGASLKNTITGTVSTGIMEKIDHSLTDKQKKEIVGTWLPSTADEQDPFHALNYGKTMTLYDAMLKGLGTRWGCQCGFEVKAPNGAKQMNDLSDSILNQK